MRLPQWVCHRACDFRAFANVKYSPAGISVGGDIPPTRIWRSAGDCLPAMTLRLFAFGFEVWSDCIAHQSPFELVISHRTSVLVCGFAPFVYSVVGARVLAMLQFWGISSSGIPRSCFYSPLIASAPSICSAFGFGGKNRFIMYGENTVESFRYSDSDGYRYPLISSVIRAGLISIARANPPWFRRRAHYDGVEKQPVYLSCPQ